MAVCPPVPQHSQLYGPHRNIGAKKLQRVLCKTYIFQDGEYNYTSKRLSKDVWQTSSARDFSFGNIEGLKTLPTEENQLESHFEIHQTDPDFPITTMQAQTTNGDYDKKISVRPYVFTEDKTVNWTDMSPRYTSRRHLGSTEYDFTYIMSHDHNPRRPRFPKINTCRMKLPPDASRFWVQRGTNFNLGSDKICSKSEQHSSFSEAHKHRSDWLHHNDEDHLLNVSMRDQERSSYVLRDGDYNSILGDFDKTSYNEYGPRTLPHWILPRVPTFNAESKRIKRRYRGRWKDVHVSEDDSEEDCEHEDRNEDLSSRDKTNELTKYARECTCPDIMSAGKNVEHDQKETHFQFGTDCNRPESMYDKDYIMAMHRTPRFYVTPSAGNLLQFDEDYSKLAVTSHCSDFSNIVASSVPDKESAQKTMNQQFKDNVRSSCNQSNSSTVDYQLSLSHEDYIPLRRPRTTNFKLHHNSTPASFLDTDGVLPHPVTKVNISEAANNFSGAFNDENLNTDGLRARKCQCRSRVNENDMAHFVMGSVPELTQSETITRFDGKPCEENETLAAGKTEFIPPFTFTHLNVSENTEDLERKGKKFPNTIMKCDYVPLEERGFTDSQEVINAKFDVLMLQSIARSHLFHHDINNEKHLISTTMNDFTEPASMTGRKLLAAR